METLGRKVQELRKAKGLTLTGLAGRIGITENGLRKIEGGEGGDIRGSTLTGLSRELGVTTDELLGLEVAS